MGIQLTVLKTRVNNAFYFQKVGVKLHSKKWEQNYHLTSKSGQERQNTDWLHACPALAHMWAYAMLVDLVGGILISYLRWYGVWLLARGHVVWEKKN